MSLNDSARVLDSPAARLLGGGDPRTLPAAKAGAAPGAPQSAEEANGGADASGLAVAAAPAPAVAVEPEPHGHGRAPAGDLSLGAARAREATAALGGGLGRGLITRDSAAMYEPGRCTPCAPYPKPRLDGCLSCPPGAPLLHCKPTGRRPRFALRREPAAWSHDCSACSAPRRERAAPCRR